MAQKKHNHLQKQSDANFDEEKHLDVEKQHQAIPIAPEGQELNEYKEAETCSNMVEEVPAEPSDQHLSLQTGMAKTSGEEINRPNSSQSTQSMQK